MLRRYPLLDKKGYQFKFILFQGSILIGRHPQDTHCGDSFPRAESGLGGSAGVKQGLSYHRSFGGSILPQNADL